MLLRDKAILAAAACLVLRAVIAPGATVLFCPFQSLEGWSVRAVVLNLGPARPQNDHANDHDHNHGPKGNFLVDILGHAAGDFIVIGSTPATRRLPGHVLVNKIALRRVLGDDGNTTSPTQHPRLDPTRPARPSSSPKIVPLAWGLSQFSRRENGTVPLPNPSSAVAGLSKNSREAADSTGRADVVLKIHRTIPPSTQWPR